MASKLLPRIEPGEARPLATLVALHALTIFAFTLARVARDGFLLSRMPVERLPYVSMVLAALTLLVARFSSVASRRFGPGTSLGVMAVAGAIAQAAFALWLREGGPGVAVVFYLWNGVYGLQLVTEFWILANESMHPGQARRLLAVVGAGGVVGGLLAGAAASVAGQFAGPLEMVLAVAVTLLVLGAVAFTHSFSRAETKAVEPEARRREWSSLAYVRALALAAVAGGVCSAVLDYQFKLQLQQRSTGAGDLTAWLGLYYGAQNVLALVGQFLTSTVLAELGVRGAALVLPLGLAGFSALGTVWPGLGPGMLARTWEAGLRNSLFRTTNEFTYFPLRESIRRPAKRFIDGALGRGAEALGGVLILIVTAIGFGDAGTLATMVMLLALGWAAAERAADAGYGQALSNSLARALRSQDTVVPSATGMQAARELLPLLDSANERHVLHAIDRLQTSDPEALAERADELEQHASERVRERVHALRPLWEKAPAGSGLSATDGRVQLAARTSDPDADVRHGAFRALASQGLRESIPFFVERLARTEDRPFAREALRTYGVRAVGTLGDYLADPATPPHVRREIPVVLGSMATQEAFHALVRASGHGSDAILLQRTLRAMTTIRKLNASVVVEPQLVIPHLSYEMAHWVSVERWIQGAAGGPEEPGVDLLRRALSERLAQSRERVFRRLALLYPPRETLRAHRALASRDARVRAMGTEYLDATLEPEHKELIQPILVVEGHSRVARDPSVPDFHELLQGLANGRDEWLRELAQFVARSLGLRLVRA